jgi:hypothetical protein
MKKKIAEALKTKYKSFGLSNEAWDRIASAKEETVTKEEDIEAGISDVATMDLIAKELQKMRDTEIQKRTDLQREHDDYKAKHPEKQTGEGEGGEGGEQKPDIAKIVAEAVAAAVKPVQDAFETFKSQTSAKEAKTLAKETFYANKWTTKFKDEADDAWDRAFELNEAKGGSMTAEELSGKATEYFNKAVQRKGADATKPFESEEGGNGSFDFSKQAKYLESEGLIPEEKK